MKALYAKYGNMYYKLHEPLTDQYSTAKIKKPMVYTTRNDRCGEVNITLDCGLINYDEKTNKEAYDDMISYIVENHIYQMDKLLPRYEMSLDFTLFDESNHRIIDEGVIVRHLERTNDNSNLLYLLGVDSVENEMYSRIIKGLSKKFDLNYRESVPCGIMGKPKRSFALKIHALRIHQLIKDEDYPENLNDFPEVYHKSCEGVAITRESYADHFNKPKDAVVFDSNVEGLDFPPIMIDGSFRKLLIDVSVLLNDYIVVYDDARIDALLEEQKPVVEPEPPADENPEENPGEGNEGEDPVNPTPGEGEGTSEGGEDTPTTPDETTGDNTDTPTPPTTGGEEGTETPPADPTTGTGSEGTGEETTDPTTEVTNE